MRSPFPGMDPYLEARWPGVHVSLVAFIQEALQPLLPPDLRARAEERVLLEPFEGASPSGRRPDVAVVERPRPRGGASEVRDSASVEPVVVEVHSEPVKDRWVTIVDVGGGSRVVTAVEVLSPWNTGAGRLNEAYRQKLEEYARGHVNVVEVDLLRSSRSRLEVGQQDLPEDRRAPYLTCVRRASRPSRWEVYPKPLREPLPAIPVPLREREADVLLELQPLVDRAYAAGAHDDLDYRHPPDPPLASDDEAWAHELLATAGRR